MKERITITIDTELLSMIKSNTSNNSERIEQLIRTGLLAEQRGQANFSLKQVIKLLIKTHDRIYPNDRILKVKG